MAAIELPRKRPTTFTIESIVGRSTPSPSKRSPPSSSHLVNDCHHTGEQSPPRKQLADHGNVSSSTSSSSSAVAATAVVTGATSAGRHLELLARFATPNPTGGGTGIFSTSAILGGGNAGAMNLAETLLRAGVHLPYAPHAELVNRANGFAGPPAAPTSTLDGSGPAGLAMFRGSIWSPQDMARRIPSEGWSASIVHPLTSAGVRPATDHMYMQNPYAGINNLDSYMTHAPLSYI